LYDFFFGCHFLKSLFGGLFFHLCFVTSWRVVNRPCFDTVDGKLGVPSSKGWMESGQLERDFEQNLNKNYTNSIFGVNGG
jgi:hypothetical protein